MQKNIKMIGAAVAFAMGLSCVGIARAADAAFEADSARFAALLAEPQKGDRLLWMRKGPFVAESGRLSEHRNLAKSLLARINKEREGADAARKEVLRRRSIVWRIVAGSPDAPARLSSTPFCGELQECALTLDRPGEFGAFVDDPLASDGRAVKMFNSHHEWCVMLMMNRIAFEPGVKYRVRARLRCEGATTARGNAFTAGVFDERKWKTTGQAVRRANAVGPNYAWYDICTFVPNDGEYFWIAPGGLNKDGDKNANAVLLDKISFELRDRAHTDGSQQRKTEALKRLQVVEAFRSSRAINRPEWMVMKVLPVTPPDLRPLVPLDGGSLSSCPHSQQPPPPPHRDQGSRGHPAQ